MQYDELSRAGAQAFREKGTPLLLAIESSCDETAAAVLAGARDVRAMTVYTQIPLHQKFGGVVPELASRSHVEKVGAVTDAALREAGVSLREIDAIAKGLALAAGKPFVGVNHIAGHIAANYLTYPDLKPPFVCLVASGGHSHIVRVDDYCSFTLFGRTRDDAAGEAFDKVARVLGLGYPGGPALEALAREGDPHAFRLHAGFNDKPTFDFSFSGLKTAVINLVHTAEQRGETLAPADVAASFQHAVVETLAEKSVRAAVESGTGTLALAGGVSANRALRGAMQRRAEAAGLRFCCPDFRFCTDNAAMIACAGYHALMAGQLSPLSLNAVPGLALAPEPSAR